MGRNQVKIIVRRCVCRWSGKEASQSSVLATLREVTVASKRELAVEINRHADLNTCADVIADSQIHGEMTVSALGQRVWDNKTACLQGLP